MRDFDLHSSIFEMFDQLAAKKKKLPGAMEIGKVRVSS